MSRAGSQLGLPRDREAGEVTQVAFGPVPAFLPSSLPQGLLETRRNHRREPQARREPWGLHELALCQRDKSLNFPEMWCPCRCGSAVVLVVAVRTQGQCECLGRTAGQAAGAHQTAALGGGGLRSLKRLSAPAPASHRPCSCSPSRPRALLQVGWMGRGTRGCCPRGFTQFSPPLSQAGNTHIRHLLF